jgi:hypothetical protein
MTDAGAVAEQAAMVAAAWSPPEAPATWRLVAAQFEALRDDDELLAIAAEVPADRLPPLLFTAAATALVLELEPSPLRDWFPRLGEPQAPPPTGFAGAYRDFLLEHRERLRALCAHHRYQMNEVGRCADVVAALAPAIAEDREIVLVDLGTSAGLGLHLDRYRYVFAEPGGRRATVGDAGSPVVIETELRGRVAPPFARALPRIVDRVGIDVEPLDLADPGVRAWLAACVPQEIGAVTRFARATELATAHGARTVQGDAEALLPDVLAGLPEGPLVCLVDAYVHVFFAPRRLRSFRALVDRVGAVRDLDWISIDPLVPMGPDASQSVLGLRVPPALLQRNRREGVFGVIGRLSYRAGARSGAVLGLAHPGAAWLEWLSPG